MKKKLAYMSVGMIFTLILSFTWLSFAAQSTEVAGNLTMIDQENQHITLFDGKKTYNYSLGTDTTIYRNDQKVALSSLDHTDEVKVILNSNQDVRYVVATYKERAVQPQPAQEPTEEPTPQPTLARETAQAIPVGSQKDGVHSQVSQTTSVKVEEKPSRVREMKIEVKIAEDHEYKLEYKNKDGKVESKIEKKSDDDKLEVKGKEAQKVSEWIIGNLALEASTNRQEIEQKVLQSLGINEGKYKELKIEIKLSDKDEVKIEKKAKKEKRSKKEDEEPKKEKGKHGLENALENVKGTPAEEVISRLIQKQ